MSSRERLQDLLVARATEGLQARESVELERALAGQSDLGPDDLDLAAAAVYLAFDALSSRSEPMPGALKRRLLGLGPPAADVRLNPRGSLRRKKRGNR